MEQKTKPAPEEKIMKTSTSRRALLKGLAVGAGAGVGTIGALNVGLLNKTHVLAQGTSPALTKGDVAILRFLAAVEILETDFWQQYNELGGIQDSEVPGGSGNAPYTKALENLDEDMPQYIHDNTEDEFTHFTFIDAYLASKGAEPVNLDRFRTLPSSQATGAQKNKRRLTNLMQLTVDTSFWTRYRSSTKNPDIDHPTFPQAVPSLDVGQHPAIPRNDGDLTPAKHIQAIANTAAFHFASIEQGGTSVYPSLAQRVSNVEVLRILLSIGPTETMHFQIWHDKAGAAVSPPLAPLTDPKHPELVFPDLTTRGPDFRPNLVMPEPTVFLSRKFPVCSIIRPTETEGAATGVAHFLTNSGLFIGQSEEFFDVLFGLAAAADMAQR